MVLSLAVIPGVAHGRWQWPLALDLTARYDSNVQLTPKGRSDMVYVVGSQVGMKYESADVEMTGSYNLSAELFATHHNLNQASQSLALDTDVSRMMASILPNESTLRFTEVMYHVPGLPNFQSLVNPSADATTGGVSTLRTKTFRNIFGINESTSLSPVTKINFSYRNIYTQYQNPALVDSQTNGVTIGLSHYLSRTDMLTAGSSYTRFNPYGGAISHLYALTVGDQHSFSPVFTGSASLGVAAALLPDLNQPQYAVNGNLSISRKVNERLQLGVQADRNFGTSSGITSTVLITDSGTVSLDQQFTKFLGGKAALNAARNYSFGAAKAIGLLVDVHSQGAMIGLNYRFASWLASNLEYQYTRQETFGSYRADLTRNQYSFTLQSKWF